jgi:hypothetical protein
MFTSSQSRMKLLIDLEPCDEAIIIIIIIIIYRIQKSQNMHANW